MEKKVKIERRRTGRLIPYQIPNAQKGRKKKERKKNMEECSHRRKSKKKERRRTIRYPKFLMRVGTLVFPVQKVYVHDSKNSKCMIQNCFLYSLHNTL